MITKAYKVRTIFVFFGFCFLYFVILFNLWLVQVMQRTYFTELGQRQYELTITTPPPRAEILDRQGKFIAMNKDSIAAFILPRQLEDSAKLKKFLKQHFPQALERLNTHGSSHFLYVKRRLTPDQIKLIEKSGVTDIKLIHEPSRYYPVFSAAPIVGITDIDNVGLMGIELAYNNKLAGLPTTYCLEKDARCGTHYFKKDVKVAGTEGSSIKLTIDSDLQFLAYEELQETVSKYHAKEGSVIIMNPENGDILAMVSIPCFDPNNTAQLNLEQTKNRCMTQAYELGSVIKVCAAMAALEENVVTPSEMIDCKGTKTAFIEGRKINTWKAHGVIPFEEVIAQSNNIGIAQVALRVGPKMYDYYTRLGFGQKTGLGLAGENKGFVNHPNNWSKQSLISLSYGYEVSATLVQLARTFSLIANGGYLIEPRLLYAEKTPAKGKQQFSTQTINTIQAMLEKTTQDGTAKKASIQGYRVMSKTGTANILENGHYNSDRNMYTCAGIVQKDEYKRVIITFVKEAAQKDLYASLVSAPLFERVAEKLLIHDKIV